MTAELNSVAANATCDQVPWSGTRMRSGRTTPKPAVAALMGTKARNQRAASTRDGHVGRARAMVNRVEPEAHRRVLYLRHGASSGEESGPRAVSGFGIKFDGLLIRVSQRMLSLPFHPLHPCPSVVTRRVEGSHHILGKGVGVKSETPKSRSSPQDG